MKTGNKKSTPEEVRQYQELRTQGWSYNKIAAKFKRDRTSIMWWCKRIKTPAAIPQEITNNPKKREEETPKKTEPGSCLNCGKQKTEKWKLTNFCGLYCWNITALKKFNPSLPKWQLEEIAN